jgi:cell division protein FtsI (penicillin-binding protein 3)
MNSRLVFIFIGLAAAWSFMILRAAHVQILPNSRLKELQSRQYKTLIELPARRGLISDRSGKELAVTIPAYSVFADPKEIESPKRFANKVAKKLGYSPAYVYERVKNRERRFVWLKRRLNKEFVESLQALKLKGLGVIEESERVYPNENLMAQVLGFVGREGQGLEGLELQFDSQLKGESRKIKIERDARGRPLLLDGGLFTETPAGYDLALTIDHELQYRLERELAQATQEYSADSALGVILDAQTSEILAIGHAPSFDPNKAAQYDRELLRNKAVTDAFEPGSTLKTFVVAGALREGTVKPNKKYFCENGRMKVGKYFIREADAAHVFGDLTVTEVLAKSSNIGTTKIALELGEEKVRRILGDFGFGARSGLELPGEAAGVLQKLPWRDHLLANISFGHGITATPLQMANAYAAIANGGTLRSPIIVKEAVQPETGERIQYKARDIRQVLTPAHAATMRLMLNAATGPTGTGKAAQVPGFPVAGKTGTAQKVVVGEGYAKDQYVSSFAGMIPANNPRYVIVVSIDNPKNKYYGSEVAAPLFSRVAGYAVRQAGLAPVLITEKSVINKTQVNTVKRERDESIAKIREMAKMLTADEQNVTPDFTGLTLREVYNRVRGTPLKVDVRGEGTVMLTLPQPGAELPVDKTIKVFFK